ncbi:unannotated protein [freshwater metagenome]|uniref:Unannotated protein n=1 Tax=freshwater metagenome TaxID=449393 RepID=A0A6J7QRT4_9ZZZZ
MRAETAATISRTSPDIARRTPSASIAYCSTSPDAMQGAGQVPSSARTQPAVSERGRRAMAPVHVRSGKAAVRASAANWADDMLLKGPR